MMKILIRIWILLAFTAVILSDSGEGCLPVKALFICTGNDLEHSRRQQRRFVLRLIDELPYRSHIALKVAGNNEEIYEFKKNTSYTYYRQDIVNHFFKLSTNNTASYKEISDAMFQFLDRNETPKIAEVIYFIVNKNTKLENIQYVNEAINNKKRFIVLHGEHLEGNLWTSLAQDEEHIQVFGDSEENVTLAVKSVKTKSCKDSKYLCDGNQYWTEEFGKKCYWCWRICDMIPSQRSDVCNQSCPSYAVNLSSLPFNENCTGVFSTIPSWACHGMFCSEPYILLGDICFYDKTPSSLHCDYSLGHSNMIKDNNTCNNNMIKDNNTCNCVNNTHTCNTVKDAGTCGCIGDIIITVIFTVVIMAVVTGVGLLVWRHIQNKKHMEKVDNGSDQESSEKDDGDTADSPIISLNNISPEVPPDLPRPAF